MFCEVPLCWNPITLPAAQVKTYSVSAWSPDRKQKRQVIVKKNQKLHLGVNWSGGSEGAEKDVSLGW